MWRLTIFCTIWVVGKSAPHNSFLPNLNTVNDFSNFDTLPDPPKGNFPPIPDTSRRLPNFPQESRFIPEIPDYRDRNTLPPLPEIIRYTTTSTTTKKPPILPPLPQYKEYLLPNVPSTPAPIYYQPVPQYYVPQLPPGPDWKTLTYMSLLRRSITSYTAPPPTEPPEAPVEDYVINDLVPVYWDSWGAGKFGATNPPRIVVTPVPRLPGFPDIPNDPFLPGLPATERRPANPNLFENFPDVERPPEEPFPFLPSFPNEELPILPATSNLPAVPRTPPASNQFLLPDTPNDVTYDLYGGDPAALFNIPGDSRSRKFRGRLLVS